MRIHTFSILSLFLVFILQSCIEPPPAKSANDPTGNESNNTSLSLGEFLNQVSHRLCEYQDKCDLFIPGLDTVDDCVADNQAYYNAWLASDCGPEMESYYSANVGDLEHCPNYIANQDCDSDDFGICPAMTSLFGDCDIPFPSN